MVPEGEPPHAPIHGIYPHRQHLSTRIQTFIEFLAADNQRRREAQHVVLHAVDHEPALKAARDDLADRLEPAGGDVEFNTHE